MRLRAGWLGAAVLVFCASWGMGQSPENLRPDQPVEQQPAEPESAEEPAVEPEAIVEPPTAPAQPSAETHDEDAGGKEDSESDRHGFKFWGDTWAQWAMAATGVVAVGISAWAVGLLRKTLIETRRATAAAQAAVDVTRELGQKELAAYVTLKNVTYEVSGYGVFVSACLRNSGNTPAVNSAIECTISLLFSSPKSGERERGDVQIVGGAAGSIEPNGEKMAFGAALQGSFADEAWAAISFNEAGVTMWVNVIWQDIFNAWHKALYMLEPPHVAEDGRAAMGSGEVRPLVIRQVRLPGYDPDKHKQREAD